jgi:hypothetical protein
MAKIGLVTHGLKYFRMENKNVKSPNKKHEISFGDMEEQAMGGAYYCPIFLNYIERSEIPNTFGTEGSPRGAVEDIEASSPPVLSERFKHTGLKDGHFHVKETSSPLLLHERNTGNAVWKGNNAVFFPIWTRSKEGYLKQQIAFFDLKKSRVTVFEKLYNFIEIKSIKGHTIEAIDSPHWQPKDIVIDTKNETIAASFSWTAIDAEIVGMKRRYEATSVAPWVTFVEGRDMELGGSSFIMTGIPKGENIWDEKRGEDIYITGGTIADQDFIAHARQDIPMLIAEIERLRKMMK